MTQLAPLPPEISRRVIKLARDGYVWKYWEFRFGPNRGMFTDWDSLTVADCEQLAEQYARLARQAIVRFCTRGGSPRSAATAAMYIARSRQVRYRYQELTGQDLNERDQTFGIMTIDEARALEAEINQA